ncbi:DUF4279 domain-containing protein [Streptosporangium carneum]|uniref:DUF4279 domain-containing protein n=1 Tax=Streptosporangium carneum TaxID=47481 RepID=A0A9W6I3T6_9ACTN|nr:DUF4279 domain-containing protein [Streptosporangium carneum]GLK10459.1 hypothetical protein GCM10017600_38650 [Streptosporangium carneum]
MEVDQYVYFALKSERMSAEEMATRLGLEADEVTIRASKRLEPPRPAVHIWRINVPRSSLPVDDMITVLVDRLEPYASAIGALADELDRHEPGHTAVLQVVRFFGDDDEEGSEEERTTEAPPRPLGWHLDRRVLDFLQTTRAELDVDEYGDTL